MIRFQCPQCQSIHAVADAVGGKKGKCKKCGQRLRVPRPLQRKKTMLGKLLPSRTTPVWMAQGQDDDSDEFDVPMEDAPPNELRPGLSFFLSLASLTFAVLSCAFTFGTSLLLVNYFVIPCNVMAVMFAMSAIAFSGRQRTWLVMGLAMLVVSLATAAATHFIIETSWADLKQRMGNAFERRGH